MVTGQDTPKAAFWSPIALLLVLAALAVDGQHAYRAVIRVGGGQPITGFLYAVNDTAIVILPALLPTPKGLEAALQNAVPIAIPTKIVRKLKIIRARSLGHDFGVGLLLATIYGIAYAAVIPLNDPVDVIPFTLAIGAMTYLTIDLFYVRKFKPTEPGFVMRMQKYCLRENGLVVDR